MEYRFVCILNNTTSNRNIDIEVCMETGSRSLSPFQRKVNGDRYSSFQNFSDRPFGSNPVYGWTGRTAVYFLSSANGE